MTATKKGGWSNKIIKGANSTSRKSAKDLLNCSKWPTKETPESKLKLKERKQKKLPQNLLSKRISKGSGKRFRTKRRLRS